MLSQIVSFFLFFALISPMASAHETKKMGAVSLKADSITTQKDTTVITLSGNAQASVHDLSLSCRTIHVIPRPDDLKTVMSISGVHNCTFKAGKKSVMDKKGFFMRLERGSPKWKVTNSTGKNAIP